MEIEAIQWTGGNAPDIDEFTNGTALWLNNGVKYYPPSQQYKSIILEIPTLEGNHRADVGDFIIKGANGEFYPCKPEIFAKTYEAVE